MPSYPSEFRLRIPGWAAANKAKLLAIARQTCMQVGKEVVENTPVDVGFLRGSWQPSLNGMESDVAGEDDPGGAAAMARISLTVADMKIGDVFYLSNNAAYALRIEFGFVGKDKLGRQYNQRGRYFVTGTVARFKSICREVMADLGVKQ